MSYTVGSGIYFKISGAEDFSVDLLRDKMQSIIDSALVLHRRRISTKDAIAHYESCGLDDKARLLRYRPRSTFDIYESGKFADYFYGEMAPNTSYIRSWDLIPTPEGANRMTFMNLIMRKQSN